MGLRCPHPAGLARSAYRLAKADSVCFPAPESDELPGAAKLILDANRTLLEEEPKGAEVIGEPFTIAR